MKKWENQPDLWNMKERTIRKSHRWNEFKNFKEFHVPLSQEETAGAGSKMYGVRRTVLPGGDDDRRHGLRLPAQQSGSGV